jgi:hypothetical protein
LQAIDLPVVGQALCFRLPTTFFHTILRERFVKNATYAGENVAFAPEDLSICSGTVPGTTLSNVTGLSIALICFAIPGFSQRLTIGAVGGLRLTGDPQTYYDTSNSKPYLVGPTIEVRLPLNFALEADALYSRLGDTFYFPGITRESTTRTIANSWEFPLLAKYRLPVPRVHPYLSVGVAPRHAGGRINTIQYGYYPSDVSFSSVGWHAHDHAFVLGGGIDVKFWHIRISPQIRYVRWGIPSMPSSSDVAHYLPVPQSEPQVLLGIWWHGR